jgi:hypothetical protein
MALQCTILVPPELWKNRSQSPPPVKKILKSKDHSYNKWTQIRLRRDPYLKTEKRKREPIPMSIAKTGGTKPSFKTKPKRTTGSMPLFKTETLQSESETNSLPMHLKYIHNVLKREVSHGPTFGVYKDNTDGSFKIGRLSFVYNDKHVFVDGKKYKAMQDPWELLTKCHNLTKLGHSKTGKHINIYNSRLMRIVIVPHKRAAQSKALNIRGLLCDCLLTHPNVRYVGNR